MLEIFLATHGTMASGMKKSLEILVGNTDCLTVFDAYLEGETDTVEQHVENFLENAKSESLKVLISDMYGGSVNQVLTRYLSQPNVIVITGINLSLLLELVCECNNDCTPESIEKIVEQSRELTTVVKLNEVNINDDLF